jgi:L-lactate dehydrogenase complex protein LldF
MTDSSFRSKIREQIADNALQAALDANAERRVQGRITAFTSLPDWQERRQRAHAVRAEVIRNLDNYLEKFVTKVVKNGIIVHRAKDAAEAIKIFLEIVGATRESPPQKLIAKSKSMVTEEIGLNHALEEAGHRVVETDLGEYIIQLRGERPSHIITPSVHMRRHEVGELFHVKLGIPYTDDIPTLTNIARKELREVFLNADVGVSGVNFGVAETGTLSIVTNEGNGRMVTTLPPIHIAVMGIERLVRNLDDLALMLSLLPRSATTQKISVYTQLLHQPHYDQQKHLILVDNGRSRLVNSPLQEILYCIRCGACLNACPVFREIGGHAYLGADGGIAPYPGPIGSVVSPGLLGDNYVHLAQASSLCGACKDACPVDIDLPKLLTQVRAGNSPRRYDDKVTQNAGEGLPTLLKFGLQMYTRLATHPSLFALSQRLAGLGARLFVPFSTWMKFPAFTGWGYSKDFPRPAAKPFRARFKEIQLRSPSAANSISSAGRQMTSTETAGKSLANRKRAGEKDLISRFTYELTALNGNVVETTPGELSTHLLNFLRERNIDRVQAWESVPGVDWAVLSKAGISVQGEADERIRAGITGALAGIAETGTLVIQSGESQALTASLLPEIHIAVLQASDIQISLEEVFNHHKVETYPSVVLVSGPSRTADIEMTLTIGVHGPGELHVFILKR